MTVTDMLWWRSAKDVPGRNRFPLQMSYLTDTQTIATGSATSKLPLPTIGFCRVWELLTIATNDTAATNLRLIISNLQGAQSLVIAEVQTIVANFDYGLIGGMGIETNKVAFAGVAPVIVTPIDLLQIIITGTNTKTLSVGGRYWDFPC